MGVRLSVCNFITVAYLKQFGYTSSWADIGMQETLPSNHIPSNVTCEIKHQEASGKSRMLHSAKVAADIRKTKINKKNKNEINESINETIYDAGKVCI